MKKLLTLLVLLAQTALAQQQQPPSGPPDSTGNRPQQQQQPAGQSNSTWNQKIQQLSFSGSGEYHLGNGDLIEVSVFGVDNFKQQVRVDSAGDVTLPYVGAMPVAGLTATQVGEKVRSLLDGKYIKNPQVSVFVVEYRSQPVFVLGAVMRPGQYQITSNLQLVDAIALAGGLNTETAAGFAIIQRRGREQTATTAQSGGPMDGQAARVTPASASSPGVPAPSRPNESTRIDLRDLLDNGNLELNVPIYGGDVVQIPEKQLERFYVIGDVNRPGAYELPTEDKLLVTQALAWAGGPLRTAKKSKGVLVRYDEKGGRQEMAINVDDIMKGKNPDITVLPNDVIFLPGSTAKSIGYGLLGVLPGTASSALVYGTVRR